MRLDVISNEISVRNDEIEIIVGKYDENGKLMMWTGEDDNGKNKYIPWDWKRVDA